MQILTLTRDVLLSFEQKQSNMSVPCDLSKVFDTLQHNKLLNKLQNMVLEVNALIGLSLVYQDVIMDIIF